jgi:hypothetical protein
MKHCGEARNSGSIGRCSGWSRWRRPSSDQQRRDAAIVGGAYIEGNLGTISHDELIRFSGKLAWQLKDIPDGEQIIMELTDEGGRPVTAHRWTVH